MKTHTILKTITYTQLEPLLHKINPKLDIQAFGDGFELDYWIEKMGKELNNEQLIKLSNKFICIGYDEDETFTLVNKQFLNERVSTYLITTEPNERQNQIVENLIQFSMAHKVRVTNDKVAALGSNADNIPKDLEILKGQLNYQVGHDTSIQELIKDIAFCGTMELYFDDISDMLDNFLPKQRIMSPILLDSVLDIVCKALPYTVYIEDREEKRRNVLIDEVDTYIQNVSRLLNIDGFSNISEIADFIINDVMECTTLEEYSSEDLAIAFRRFVESE